MRQIFEDHVANIMHVRGLSRSGAEPFAYENTIVDCLNPTHRHAVRPLRSLRQARDAGRDPAADRRRHSPRMAARSMLVRMARATSRRGDRSARPLGHCGGAIAMTGGNPCEPWRHGSIPGVEAAAAQSSLAVAIVR